MHDEFKADLAAAKLTQGQQSTNPRVLIRGNPCDPYNCEVWVNGVHLKGADWRLDAGGHLQLTLTIHPELLEFDHA